MLIHGCCALHAPKASPNLPVLRPQGQWQRRPHLLLKLMQGLLAQPGQLLLLLAQQVCSQTATRTGRQCQGHGPKYKSRLCYAVLYCAALTKYQLQELMLSRSPICATALSCEAFC